MLQNHDNQGRRTGTDLQVGATFGPGPLVVAQLTGEVGALGALCWEALSVADPVRVGGWPEAREEAYRQAGAALAEAVGAAGLVGLGAAVDRVLAEQFPGQAVAVGRRAKVLAQLRLELEV